MGFIFISSLENTIDTFEIYLWLLLQWFEKKNHIQVRKI